MVCSPHLPVLEGIATASYNAKQEREYVASSLEGYQGFGFYNLGNEQNDNLTKSYLEKMNEGSTTLRDYLNSINLDDQQIDQQTGMFEDSLNNSGSVPLNDLVSNYFIQEALAYDSGNTNSIDFLTLNNNQESNYLTEFVTGYIASELKGYKLAGSMANNIANDNLNDNLNDTSNDNLNNKLNNITNIFTNVLESNYNANSQLNSDMVQENSSYDLIKDINVAANDNKESLEDETVLGNQMKDYVMPEILAYGLERAISKPMSRKDQLVRCIQEELKQFEQGEMLMHHN